MHFEVSGWPNNIKLIKVYAGGGDSSNNGSVGLDVAEFSVTCRQTKLQECFNQKDGLRQCNGWLIK